MTNLLNHYKKKVAPSLTKKFAYKNIMQCPKVEKVVINIGIGEAKDHSKSVDIAVNELTLLSGQKAVVTKAKKSISNFKLRQGMSIGCKVTLRGARMYDFLDRLFNIAMPRIRDFQGSDYNSFDSNGNYNLGIKEQYIFPEIDLDKSDRARGMNITIVCSSKNIEQNRAMLFEMGMPFKKRK
ncbi:MAG: 50S ribosomal protein L5 [Elusimicrobiota bacterium]|jgi:large subunit ribosomal protein L5|nr:50S ribosomal protein L5 [Elusimicrobiota bacterium]